ncbi:hypothetical protein M3Y98_00718400 [Aphelenchoides besseyi]|nr:hypothetical protein M3Y98_00718400 [Aphelenchoides besseyi]KAI6210261.1 hypothetical protein M3Y96_00309400 [Aphelenchoides besseyi]
MHIVYYEGFEQSDNETGRSEPQHIPAPGSMLISTGFAATNPLESEDERSKETLVMMELGKRPQFIYYDYKTLHSKFSSLPASIWANSANCELMVIRLDSSEWTGNVDLNGLLGRFTLNDRFGYFVVYAKPGAQHLAQQFGQFTTSFVSFGTFSEHVNGMGFRSALIIGSELDHVTIRHLKSPRFLIP